MGSKGNKATGTSLVLGSGQDREETQSDSAPTAQPTKKADTFAEIFDRWVSERVQRGKLANDPAIAEHLKKHVGALRSDVVQHTGDPARVFDRWLRKHVHNTVVSRSTEHFNHLQKALTDLSARLKSIKE